MRRWVTDLGATHFAKHTINVDDHPPIKQKFHVRSPAVMDEMNKVMNKLIDQKFVEPLSWQGSRTEHIVCALTRDIIHVTKEDANPLPPMRNILDQHQQDNCIGSIDLDQAFYQVYLDEESKENAVFTVPGRGLF